MICFIYPYELHVLTLRAGSLDQSVQPVIITFLFKNLALLIGGVGACLIRTRAVLVEQFRAQAHHIVNHLQTRSLLVRRLNSGVGVGRSATFTGGKGASTAEDVAAAMPSAAASSSPKFSRTRFLFPRHFAQPFAECRHFGHPSGGIAS